MKNTALKATVVALLLAPLMSFAAVDTTNVQAVYTSALLHNGVANNTLNVTASWIDMVAKKGSSSAEVESTTVSGGATNGFTYLLTGPSKFSKTGTFADSVSALVTETLTLPSNTFTGLAIGDYTLKITGNWSLIDNYTKTVSPSLSATTSFSAVSPVPEPESYAMLLAGLGLMGTIAVRRKSNQA